MGEIEDLDAADVATVDRNTTAETNTLALYFAVSSKRARERDIIPYCRELIEQGGADVNYTDPGDDVSLTLCSAIKCQNAELVSLLLDHGANHRLRSGSPGWAVAIVHARELCRKAAIAFLSLCRRKCSGLDKYLLNTIAKAIWSTRSRSEWRKRYYDERSRKYYKRPFKTRKL